MEGKINVTVVIIGIIILFSSAMVGVGLGPTNKGSFSPITAELVNPSPSKNKDALQIQALAQITPSLTPIPTSIIIPTVPASVPVPTSQSPCPSGTVFNEKKGICKKLEAPFTPLVKNPLKSGFCFHGAPANSPADCCFGVAACEDSGAGQSDPQLCQDIRAAGKIWCAAKPVIYLYPQVKTIVNVLVKTNGAIIKSNPSYPPDGWENIVSYPSGSFMYQNKLYRELFYESSIVPIESPKTGRVISISDIKDALQEITLKLGLNLSEQEEFLQYWVPRLKDLAAPYILVSYFDESTKNSIDRVEILPKPDTFIQFLLYFKPLQKPIFINPLILPSVIPQRNGFTAVEWGGIIDY